jgi:cellulose synthase/poly-beta-1,6-N-acetylglucosamine synthase-like glycosyltransferase
MSLLVTREPAPAVYWPGVSVVIAARNAAATIERCLASVKALDYPEVEIIVVDDGSSDTTADLARAAGVRVLETGGRCPSVARNLGVEHSSYEIVAFTDSDCVVSRGWLKALVDVLRRRRAASAGGPQTNVFPDEVGNDAKDLDAFFSLASVVSDYARQDDEEREVDHNASCNSAYIRHAFLEAGGFTPDMYPGEDVDLDFKLHRLGYRSWYAPGARVEHLRPGTTAWFTDMMRRYGRIQRELVERHGRFRPLHYLPHALAALLLAQALWGPRRTRAAVAFVDGALVAGAIALLASRVPRDRWAAVLRYAIIAVREWTLGYLEGMPPKR